MNILRQMYNGKMHPADTIIPDTEEYWKSMQEMDRFEEQLKKGMTREQIDMLDEYFSIWSEHESLIQEEVFCQAFIMGAELQREIGF